MTAASQPLLEQWARLCRVWTVHSRGSAAFAYLENSDFLLVGHRRIMAKHGVGIELLFDLDFLDRGRACARGGGVCVRLATRVIYGIIVELDSSEP